MTSVQYLLTALLLAASPVVLADKPDPGLANPPLQVWIAGGEVIDADVDVQNAVEIKNDTGDPISVNVGEPTVHVGSMPAVLAPEPFQKFEDYSFSGGKGVVDLIYTVPEDKRLVIEFISAYVHLGDTDNRLDEFYIQTPDADFHTPPLKLFNIDEGAYYRGSQLVKIYADPNDQVFIGMTVDDPCLNGCTFKTTITGHLIQVD